jgi:hypothetical protein
LAVDEILWIGSYSPERFPPWPCSHCGRSSLGIVPNSLRVAETRESQEIPGHPDWDPSWKTEQFVCLLRCQNCSEIYSVAGISSYQEAGGPSLEFLQVLEPRYIEPAPQIFVIPRGYPKEAKKELEAAFSLYWPDPGAALNRLRTSMELYLDAEGVQRKARKKDGSYRQLSLHERIQRFAAKHSEIDETMLAVKWLGNLGSHESSVSRQEALEAFELLDFILEEVVAGRRSRLKRMAKAINKAKGRVKVKPPF